MKRTPTAEEREREAKILLNKIKAKPSLLFMGKLAVWEYHGLPGV
ncbi:unnamed protein product [Gulo gulo]|uniref:Uncharacterized protein n=1 Tax=Gulo gulo TaxID=48420 RepID=A0A9X9Q280_GULGU|nr:unnamed protein product [Gulo gulo]